MTDACWFVPEIHDVHPGTADATARLLDRLPESARTQTVFCIVPDWDGRGPITSDRAFLARTVAAGGERVLHGLTHNVGENLWNRLRYGTPNHAEFSRLSEDDARRRTERGIAIFTEAFGDPPAWFCAPRWQQSAAATAVLCRSGLGYMLRDRCVGADGQVLAMPAIWFDEGRRAWASRAAAPLRGRRIGRLVRAGTPFRLVLHPGDLDDRRVAAELDGVLAALAAGGWASRSLSGALAETTR